MTNRPPKYCKDLKMHQMTQRGIESLNSEWSTNAKKESLLPKGEGQDEGEPRSKTRRQNVFLQTLNCMDWAEAGR
jgi:hypothetical protein